MNIKKLNIYFRADGNEKIGLGHVIRSLSLADMLKNSFNCHFISNRLPDKIEFDVKEICRSLIPLNYNNKEEEAIYLSNEVLTSNDILVIDGYEFNTKYQNIVKRSGCKLVAIDDIHAHHFVSDVIINHSEGVDIRNYSVEPYTSIYLGAEYALLRKPFRDKKYLNSNSNKRQNKTLVCLGGADPNNDTIKVLSKCETLPSFQDLIVVIGPSNQHLNVLQNYSKNSSSKIEYVSNLSALEMVKLMLSCSKAITSPSTVSYEYLSTHGELYLKQIADNQKYLFNYLIKRKMAFNFDELTSSTKFIPNFSGIEKIFDHDQSKRFLKIFNSL